jgi:hypothetical protein
MAHRKSEGRRDSCALCCRSGCEPLPDNRRDRPRRCERAHTNTSGEEKGYEDPRAPGSGQLQAGNRQAEAQRADVRLQNRHCVHDPCDKLALELDLGMAVVKGGSGNAGGPYLAITAESATVASPSADYGWHQLVSDSLIKLQSHGFRAPDRHVQVVVHPDDASHRHLGLSWCPLGFLKYLVWSRPVLSAQAGTQVPGVVSKAPISRWPCSSSPTPTSFVACPPAPPRPANPAGLAWSAV